MVQTEGNATQNENVKISMLHKRQDFLRIASGRIKWVAGSMIVQMANRPENDKSENNASIRVGYTASKKVGNAVCRNRAKRRLREVVRRALPAGGKGGHDYVVIARSAVLDIPFDQLIRDFSWCLKRLGQSNDKNKKPALPGESHGKPEQSTSGGVKR
ncbi:Ribonuclease P protein component [hydrothermal vent metagenome]|uniref:Ribonuclease P protein component n=1 Tax=hydrothermal vent metagenome TaxID=652676 RepID=A0A3B1B4R2_9ZZZZ